MYYFASDVHLGADLSAVDGVQRGREVERRFVEWLKMAGRDAEAIFLLGDIFDFWFEYDYVVPKGFVRVLGEIAALTDRGVRVVFMAGNHDMWVGKYLSEECGVELYTAPRVFDLEGCKVHIAHGDNLNVTGDLKLKMLNGLFRSKAVRSLFSTLLHPNLALRFGLWWSGKSRKKHGWAEGHNTLDGIGVRPLIEYATQQQERKAANYYMYGHLHQTLRHRTSDSNGREFEVIFINDWSDEPHYLTLDKSGVVEIHDVQ